MRAQPASSATRRSDTRIVTAVVPEDRAPAQVSRRFRALLDAGAELLPAGRARHDPEVLLTPRHLPRHEVRLFDATISRAASKVVVAILTHPGLPHQAPAVAAARPPPQAELPFL